jgi:hypothetical protein
MAAAEGDPRVKVIFPLSVFSVPATGDYNNKIEQLQVAKRTPEIIFSRSSNVFDAGQLEGSMIRAIKPAGGVRRGITKYLSSALCPFKIAAAGLRHDKYEEQLGKNEHRPLCRSRFILI